MLTGRRTVSGRTVPGSLTCNRRRSRGGAARSAGRRRPRDSLIQPYCSMNSSRAIWTAGTALSTHDPIHRVLRFRGLQGAGIRQAACRCGPRRHKREIPSGPHGRALERHGTEPRRAPSIPLAADAAARSTARGDLGPARQGGRGLDRTAGPCIHGARRRRQAPISAASDRPGRARCHPPRPGIGAWLVFARSPHDAGQVIRSADLEPLASTEISDDSLIWTFRGSNAHKDRGSAPLATRQVQRTHVCPCVPASSPGKRKASAIPAAIRESGVLDFDA